jgi:ribosome-associated protein
MSGYSLDAYAKMMGGDVNTMRNAFRPAAEKQAKINVTLTKIIETEGIAVSEEEMEAEFESMAKQYEMEVSKIKEMVAADELKASLENRKAINIKVLKIDKLTAVADYFVICNGTSVTQIKAIADEVEFKLEQAGVVVSHREGYSSGNWILLDYDSIVVHIFHPTARDYYNLEKLWADAEEIDIAQFEE